MVDNQHKKIKGYRDLTNDEIAKMNLLKQFEVDLKVLLDGLLESGAPRDASRWLAVAKTNLETGFMYAVKAVARPTGQMGSDE